MINVSSATKAAWMSDRKVNHLVVSFPDLNLTYENDSIEPDSLSWTEALCNADSMEFVGCIASSFGASIYNIPDNVKGQYIEVTFQAGNTDIIPIFKGYVDSVEIESDSLFKKIKAYDALYNAGQVDVASWYARLSLPMTLGDIRASLMDYVGLTEVEDTELPNDDVMIYRTLENPDTIKGLTVIKSICQLNGACGIINREGLFEYRYVKESMESSYQLLYHESLKYEEYYCNSIQRVQIRDTEDDAGVVTSSYGNKYIVQANMFAYELATDALRTMANNILAKINGFTYHPMRSIQNGLPFFEVGDTLECVVDPEGYGVDTFLILSRTLTGVQFCRDTFEARGTQNQSEYISDIQAEVEVLKRTTTEIRNLSTKVVDYILPTNIEESDIASGSNSNVIEFDIYNSAQNETTSFYASLDFNISTDANLATHEFGDCTLTVTFIKDGTNVEIQTHTFGDGANMIMLNYLLTSLSKGNHTFKIKFALSGGSMSSIQVISAYILAASVVEEGNFDEEYEVDIDQDFVDYMYEEAEVGEDIELSVPTGGTEIGNFDGSQFCSDWLSAFELPIECGKIFAEKSGLSMDFLDAGNAGEWSGFIVPFEWQRETFANIQIPHWLDNDVYQQTGHHINMWFASLTLSDNTQTYFDTNAYNITGVYIPEKESFRMTANYPTQGYAVFEMKDGIYTPTYTATNKSSGLVQSGNVLGKRYFNDGTWSVGGVRELQEFIMIYNPNAFKNYLSRLDAPTIQSLLSAKEIILAECNISKNKG